MKLSADDMIVGKTIPNGKTVVVDAQNGEPQTYYRIKGTHLFVDSSDVKDNTVAKYLPNYWDMDNLSK